MSLTKPSTTKPSPLSNQLLNSLPPTTATITTYNPQTRLSTFHEESDSSPLKAWHNPIDNNQMAFFSLFHTATTPASPAHDLTQHQTLITTTKNGPPLVVPNGTVCRMVDFAPGYSTVMHRSHSVDYGVVIEGQIELVLDSGEVRPIERGGMTVQRGTMHLWRNPSARSWARMFFVLVAAEPVVIDGKIMEEDLGGL